MKKIIALLFFLPIFASALSTNLPFQGGTGTNVIPTYGLVLRGTSAGVYTPVATSSLGLLGSYDAWTHPAVGVSATTSEIRTSGGLFSNASSTINASTTISGILTLLGATTSASSGVNIGTGCFAVNEVCLQTFIQNATAYKSAANYATAAVLPGTPTYNNGSSGVGATLTEVGFGALVVDGQTVTLGQRILVKNQADQTQNGVYTVSTVGSAIASYLLTRATDFNTVNDVYAGVTVPVLAGGTANGDTLWTESTTGTITIGSSNIVFIESSLGTNTIPATQGGTGLTTVATGDLLYGSGTNTWANRTIGTNGFVLAASGGLPTWVATTTFSNGLAYSAGVASLATIAGNSVLANITSGSAIPTALATSSLFTFPWTVSNGGTGTAVFTQGWIYSFGGTGALAASTSPTVNYITATSTTATSTFAYGINAATSGGCIAVNGKCLGGTPTVTVKTSGSGTYTSPAGIRWIRVRLVGGGGGGGANCTGAGGARNGGVGGNTTFGAVLTGTGGTGGNECGGQAAGGAASGGDFNIPGGDGGSAASGVANVSGGAGGNSAFGGGGGGGYGGTPNGNNGATNSGGGGGGGGGTAGTGPGGAGAAGGYVEKIFATTTVSMSYAVGAAGTAGAGAQNGGTGAVGILIIEENY